MEQDAELARRFTRLGETEAFVLLVGRHIAGIRRLLYTLFVGHKEDMEDAEQEVLLALFRDLHRFTGRSSFKTYLYSLCRNRAVDILRKKARQRRITGRLAAHPPPAPADPEEAFLDGEERREALRLLFQLDDDSRVMLLLRDVEGLSLEETARALGRPVGTVKSRLHRAREKLAAAWAERYADGVPVPEAAEGGSR